MLYIQTVEVNMMEKDYFSPTFIKIIIKNIQRKYSQYTESRQPLLYIFYLGLKDTKKIS